MGIADDMDKKLNLRITDLLSFHMGEVHVCRKCGSKVRITIPQSLANKDLIKVLEILKVWVKRMGRGLVSVRELFKDKADFDYDAKQACEMVNKIMDKVYLESEIKDILDDGTKLGTEEGKSDS